MARHLNVEVHALHEDVSSSLNSLSNMLVYVPKLNLRQRKAAESVALLLYRTRKRCSRANHRCEALTSNIFQE
jgi:hypothetical protein